VAGVDLTRPRATVVEKVLVDRCTISRNPAGWRTTEFDEDTGRYVVPDQDVDVDVTTLATAVPAAAREWTTRDTTESDGGGDVVVKNWSVKLGFDAAPDGLAIGDVVVFDTSTDPDLVGLKLYVTRVHTGTIRVWREVDVARRVNAVDRH
jgi:hypothetical protein